MIEDLLKKLNDLLDRIGRLDHIEVTNRQRMDYYRRVKTHTEKIRKCSTCRADLPIDKFYKILINGKKIHHIFVNGRWINQKQYLCNKCNCMRRYIHRIKENFRRAS